MKSKSIRIVGHSNFLKDLIHNRITDRMIHKITNNSSSNLTICFQLGEFLETEITTPCIIIRPWNENIVSFNIKNCVELHLRDLLCIDLKKEWGNNDLLDWVNALDSNSPLDLENYPLRFWTSIKDVISLIETLIELPKIPTLVTNVCGRRPWVAKDVFSELKMLWRRIDNAKKNTIDHTDLEVKTLPVTNVKLESGPPDLSKLHNLIKPLNERGWSPNTPLRISLMECLEGFLEK